jgi:hypothetical protein
MLGKISVLKGSFAHTSIKAESKVNKTFGTYCGQSNCPMAVASNNDARAREKPRRVIRADILFFLSSILRFSFELWGQELKISNSCSSC